MRKILNYLKPNLFFLIIHVLIFTYIFSDFEYDFLSIIFGIVLLHSFKILVSYGMMFFFFEWMTESIINSIKSGLETNNSIKNALKEVNHLDILIPFREKFRFLFINGLLLVDICFMTGYKAPIVFAIIQHISKYSSFY